MFAMEIYNKETNKIMSDGAKFDEEKGQRGRLRMVVGEGLRI